MADSATSHTASAEPVELPMPSPDGPTRHRGDWPAFGALALVSLAIQLPFLRRGLSIHDEGSILAIAEALSRG